jgi:hypothetical protein
MNRKFLSGISLAGIMLFATFALAQNPRQTPPQRQDRDPNQQQQQATKSISGKVTNIGDDRRSFTLQPDSKSNDNQQSMQFVIDDHTQVRGRVTTGTLVLVEYTPADGGKNLAVTIAPQGGGNGQ